MGPGTLGLIPTSHWDVPRYPETSQALWDLGPWDLYLLHTGMSSDILGHPGLCGTWDPGTYTYLTLGCPQISWDIPGFVGPGTLGLIPTLPWDVLGHSRLCNTRNPGTYAYFTLGCPQISWDIPGFVGPGTWDLYLPYPGMSWDLPGFAKPGTLGLIPTSHWDVPRYPGRSRALWDMGLWDLYLLHTGMSWDIPGFVRPGTLGLIPTSHWDVSRYPGRSRALWDMGLWDLYLLHTGMSWDIPAFVRPGTLGLYLLHSRMSPDILGHSGLCGTWDPGTSSH